MSYKVEFRLPSITPYAYVSMTLEAASAAELDGKIQFMQARARTLGQIENALIEAFNRGEGDTVVQPSHEEAVATVADVLGGTVVEESAPAQPWAQKQQTVQAAAEVAPAPWQNPAPAAAPKPWEKAALPAAEPVAPAAPAGGYTYDGPRVKFDYIDLDSLDAANKAAAQGWIEERKNAMGKAFALNKNSFSWNAEEKCYRFHRNPNAASTEWLQGFLSQYGGTIL